MPILEYSCDQCGETFEKMVRLSEADHSPTCPNCQSQHTHKKLSRVMSFGASVSSSAASGASSCAPSGGFS